MLYLDASFSIVKLRLMFLKSFSLEYLPVIGLFVKLCFLSQLSRPIKDEKYRGLMFPTLIRYISMC